MSTTARNAGVLPPGIAAVMASQMPTGPDAELIRLR